MTTKLIRKGKYSSRSLPSACRSWPLVMPSKPPGTGRASASSVIAIATTASEKKMTRSAALPSTCGSSVSSAGALTGGALTVGLLEAGPLEAGAAAGLLPARVPSGRRSCDSSDGAITTATPGPRRAPRQLEETIDGYNLAATRSLRVVNIAGDQRRAAGREPAPRRKRTCAGSCAARSASRIRKFRSTLQLRVSMTVERGDAGGGWDAEVLVEVSAVGAGQGGDLRRGASLAPVSFASRANDVADALLEIARLIRGRLQSADENNGEAVEPPGPARDGEAAPDGKSWGLG